jgi:hypothetical protein
MRRVCGAAAMGAAFVLLAIYSHGWAADETPENPFSFARLQQSLGMDWQVRVEQRVIIRIPSRSSTPASTNGTSDRPIKYKEAKIGNCLMMDRLVASRPGPKNSLELATRDGVVIRAYLDDSCLSREFYAGAYMERPLDGKLCVKRDFVHARTGAKCEIDKFRVLQPS